MLKMFFLEKIDGEKLFYLIQCDASIWDSQSLQTNLTY